MLGGQVQQGRRALPHGCVGKPTARCHRPLPGRTSHSVPSGLGSSAVAEAARDAVRRTAGQWSVAASCGLAYAPMRESAAALLDLAAEHLDDPSAAAALEHGRIRIADGLPAIAKECP